MTVKELIEELKTFDENLLIIMDTSDEAYEPHPTMERHGFDITYWNRENKLCRIFKDTDYISL